MKKIFLVLKSRNRKLISSRPTWTQDTRHKNILNQQKEALKDTLIERKKTTKPVFGMHGILISNYENEKTVKCEYKIKTKKFAELVHPNVSDSNTVTSEVKPETEDLMLWKANLRDPRNKFVVEYDERKTN
jgi:hypothetical protein